MLESLKALGITILIVAAFVAAPILIFLGMVVLIYVAVKDFNKKNP